MHTLARPPVRAAHLKQQVRLRAFTLVELLTVIAIIAILAAIALGVVKGVNERAAISQSKTELSSLAQALEAYKLQYGDYPQAGLNAADPSDTVLSAASTQYILFNALAGKLGPQGAAIGGKSFVDVSKFSLFSASEDELPQPTGNAAVDNAFVDPWGRLYVYYYRAAGASGTRWSSYILLTAGPDGETGITNPPDATTGKFDSDEKLSADNIYANR